MPVDPRPFIPIMDFPDELAGLTPQLLADVYDIVSKIGEPHESSSDVTWIRIHEVPQLIVTLCVDADTHSLRLAYAGVATMVPHHVLIVNCGALVLWDARLPVFVVETFVRIIDRQLKAADRIHPLTGERLAENEEPKLPTLYRVDDVFRERGNVVHVDPNGPASRWLRLQFDRPEEVAVIRVTNNPIQDLLCRRSDIPFLERRNQILAEVVHLFGYGPHALPDETTRAAIRTEVERQLALEFGEASPSVRRPVAEA